MAEKLCTLRTKGGGGGATQTETVLWQNSSPSTSASAFTCELSDDWTNYDYIKITTQLTTTNSTNLSQIFAKDELAKCRTVSGTTSFNLSATLYLGSGGFYCRRGTASSANNTTISFGQATQLAGTGSNSAYIIPLQIVGISKGRVPSYKTVKDFIHAKVFDSGLPEIDTYTVYSNRITVTEGKVVADAVTHKVYMYFDFTTNSAIGSASDWASILNFTSATVNYTPVYTTNSRATNIPLITDDSSDVPARQFCWGYGTSNYPYKLFMPYGSTAQANEHYIVYAEYTYK